MRIVIDTNVLISGAFFAGAPSKILDACAVGELKLALSAEVVKEYRRVGEVFTMKRPNIDFERFLGVLISKAIFVEPVHINENICRDPDDIKFIECALASNSNCLISGDKDLLAVKSYGGVTICTPRVFVDEFLTK